MNNCIVILLIWNIVVLLVYGLDKTKARRSKRRIRESTLLSLTFFFGGIGAMFGMILFNHKTSKIKFRLLVPAFAVINIVITYFLVAFCF